MMMMEMMMMMMIIMIIIIIMHRCDAIIVTNVVPDSPTGRSELWVANVGDSRCILARADGSRRGIRVVEMSKDHKPDDRRERERIHGLGGFCEPSRAGPRGPFMGPSRAWVRRQQEGGACMTCVHDMRARRHPLQPTVRHRHTAIGRV
eukprot:COSAG01_NODE_1555_length_9928_cov_20.399837_1_plen_148_part_00